MLDEYEEQNRSDQDLNVNLTDLPQDNGQELEEAFAGNQKKIDEEIKKPRKQGFSFKPNQLKDDGNGVNHIFKAFTMQPETISNLRGRGHEMQDLKHLMDVYRGWH